MKIRVYYEDTDAGGIVYHSNYLNFCERARSEYFFAQGSVPILEGGEFVVSSLEAKFKSSAKLGDSLDVKTEVQGINKISLFLKQSVYKEELLLFDMDIKLTFIKSGKIGRMSAETQEYIREIFTKEV